MGQDTTDGHRAAGDVALTEQFDNHDGGRPPHSDILAGRRLTLVGSGATTELTFQDGHGVLLTGEGLGPTQGGDGAAVTAECEVLEIRDGIVAVAIHVDSRHSTFLVLDLAAARAFAVVTAIEDSGSEGVRERSEVIQAGIGAPLTEVMAPTDALVGKRIQWNYSTTHAFEHIYLNPNTYVWHGLAGPERWIGDVDPYAAYEVADDLFLFTWSETVVPFNGAVLLDLSAWRSAGRFFGWDTVRRRSDQIVVGAEGSLLNVTKHELG